MSLVHLDPLLGQLGLLRLFDPPADARHRFALQVDLDNAQPLGVPLAEQDRFIGVVVDIDEGPGGDGGACLGAPSDRQMDVRTVWPELDLGFSQKQLFDLLPVFRMVFLTPLSVAIFMLAPNLKVSLSSLDMSTLV